MKHLLIPTACLTLLAVNIMALNAIESTNEGFVLYGWVVLLFSAILLAIATLKLFGKK